MNILYTLNNNFVPQVASGICSICENNKNIKEIKFFLFSKGISNINKDNLIKLVKMYKRKIEIIELHDLKDYFDFEYDTTGWNDIVLARLLIGKLLPQTIKKILYLDGDTIVRGSLGELWNTNLKSKAIGMSIEPTINKKRLKDLGLENYPYYNAGVLLIDLEKWREKKFEEKILCFYKKNNGKLFANDQDAINGALKDYIYTLPPKYNFCNVFNQYPYWFLKKLMNPVEYISKDIYRESKKNPCIIHYLGEERPWRKGNHHKYKKDFIKYLNLSGFDIIYESGWSLYFICYYLFNIFTKPFPSIRYKIMDYLIPKVLNYRSKQKNKNHTFVILAYKESPFLEECIKSTINQSIKTNIIIATTTDNKFIRNLAEKYSIELVIGEHKSIGEDFDFAKNIAKTELVTVAHQDDIYDLNYVKNVIKYNNKNNLIIFTDYYEIRNGRKVKTNLNLIIKRILLIPLLIKFFSQFKFIKRLVLRFGNSICCPAVTFVKNNIEDNLFKSSFKCNVDWYAWEKLSKQNGKFIYIPKKLMGHRIDSSTTTTEKIRNGIRSKEDLIMFNKFWPKNISSKINKLYNKSLESNKLK